MNKPTIISLIVIIIFLGAGILLLKSSKPVTEKLLVANFEECVEAGYPVMESFPRQCRVPSGELFVESVSNPNPSDRIAAGYITGHVTIGPNCPGPERIDYPCPIPPEAYSSRAVVIYESDGTTINENGKIDTEGNYKIALGPGNYFVQIIPAGIGPGEKKSATVKSFETTVVDFDIDTGIR